MTFSTSTVVSTDGSRRTTNGDGMRDGALPATGVVLIGTAGTIRQMSETITALDGSCVVSGCVMLDRFSGGREDARDGDALPGLLGFVEDLIALHTRHRFRLALVSVPAKHAKSASKARAILDRLGVPTRLVPTREDLVLGAWDVTPASGVAQQQASATIPAQPAQIDPAELIGRGVATIDRGMIEKIIKGKRVLVTGAGGSIGSELARVCAEFEPSALLLMERAENALFQIDHMIGRRFPGVTRRGLLHDANDAEQTLRVMLEVKPDVVFHAAAHKHVPLMEDHPALAVGNNLFATKSVADAAVACGAERFVLISSDKAVNPTSVMGATKRLAELYVASLAGANPRTRLSMVRFGNVLASACSVVPIWSQQMADGGPVTVTDPRMTRYFMTIPEAAALVVQAAALQQPTGHAPVYVLDMGEPVRILDLAERFVAMHGFRPRVKWTPETAGLIRNDPTPRARVEAGDDWPAMDVIFTGVRPGEKLFEQLAYDAEQLTPTEHGKINRWSFVAPGENDPAAGLRMAADLMPMRVPSADKGAVVAAISRWVPELATRLEKRA